MVRKNNFVKPVMNKTNKILLGVLIILMLLLFLKIIDQNKPLLSPEMGSIEKISFDSIKEKIDQEINNPQLTSVIIITGIRDKQGDFIPQEYARFVDPQRTGAYSTISAMINNLVQAKNDFQVGFTYFGTPMVSNYYDVVIVPMKCYGTCSCQKCVQVSVECKSSTGGSSSSLIPACGVCNPKEPITKENVEYECLHPEQLTEECNKFCDDQSIPSPDEPSVTDKSDCANAVSSAHDKCETEHPEGVVIQTDITLKNNYYAKK